MNFLFHFEYKIIFIYIGVRTFCPKAVAKMLENVGGASALLGLIAMATDVEELYAAVKALVCVVKSNKNILKDMDRIQGYQVQTHQWLLSPRDSGEGYSNSGHLSVRLSVCPSATLSCLRDNLSKAMQN